MMQMSTLEMRSGPVLLTSVDAGQPLLRAYVRAIGAGRGTLGADMPCAKCRWTLVQASVMLWDRLDRQGV